MTHRANYDGTEVPRYGWNRPGQADWTGVDVPDPTLLTAARLREMLHYDPETGVFTWLIDRPGGVKGGMQAGRLDSRGYIVIRVGGCRWLAHRLAWFYMTGERPIHEVDHRDTVRNNNRWSNLRPATRRQNGQNLRAPRSDNSTGYLGVSSKRGSSSFVAQIKVNGKTKHLGTFADPAEAHRAYLAAKREVHPYGTL